MSKYSSCTVILILVGLMSAGCHPAAEAVVSPHALAVSQPVPVNQVEDAAIWMHPSDPARSLLFVSNKTRGLEVHRPDGLLLKHYEDGTEFAGVDVLYEFPEGEKTVDLVVAACQTAKTSGVEIWRIDPVKLKLKEATVGSMIAVLDHGTPLGVCTYHSRKSGKSYFFVTSAAGQIEQHEIIAGPGGEFTAKLARSFSLPGKVKGGVVDDERGVVYFAQEKVGVFRFPAEPADGSEGKLIIRLGEHGLFPDLTGIAMYGAANGQGYLIVVSQGKKGTNSAFQVYRRAEPNAFVLRIDPSSEGYSAPRGSSGIVVSNGPMGDKFPSGMLGAKDRLNPNGIEDYKLYSWKDIALPGGLLIDTTWSPRPSHASANHH